MRAEVGVLREHGIWDQYEVDIPNDTSEDKQRDVAEMAAMEAWKNDSGVVGFCFLGIYPGEEDDEDIEE
jgi:hypothetical protein